MALRSESRKRITTALIESLKFHFHQPNFDFDEGVIELVGSDERGIFLELIGVDHETGGLEQHAAGFWFIEVSFSPTAPEGT